MSERKRISSNNITSVFELIEIGPTQQQALLTPLGISVSPRQGSLAHSFCLLTANFEILLLTLHISCATVFALRFKLGLLCFVNRFSAFAG